MQVKTLHGVFPFALQKYRYQGIELSYFDWTEQLGEHHVSPGLQELCGYYSNRLSYEEVAQVVKRMTGAALLSDQGIWHIVNTKAQSLSAQLWLEADQTLEQVPSPVITVNPQLDLYDLRQNEILLFDDGIQVKGQKSSRRPAAIPVAENCQAGLLTPKSPVVNTDIVMLQRPNGSFEYLSAPIDTTGEALISLAEVVKAKLLRFYGNEPDPLNIVVITDGAKAIRARLLAIFGVAVMVILDWYHLCKKVRNLMSMIARNKVERSLHLKFLFSQLWHGETAVVLEYLNTQVSARKPESLLELMGYLEKHQSEIIDYSRRSKAGKTIGSGRVEKGVDLAVGHRQKNKGMSWRKQGSKTLALLKLAELNGQWHQLWFPARIA